MNIIYLLLNSKKPGKKNHCRAAQDKTICENKDSLFLF